MHIWPTFSCFYYYYYFFLYELIEALDQEARTSALIQTECMRVCISHTRNPINSKRSLDLASFFFKPYLKEEPGNPKAVEEDVIGRFSLRLLVGEMTLSLNMWQILHTKTSTSTIPYWTFLPTLEYRLGRKSGWDLWVASQLLESL